VADEPTATVDDDAREQTHEQEAPAEPEVLYGAPVSWMRGQRVLHPSRSEVKKVLKAAHDDGYLMCVDVTAVDYLVFGENASANGSDRPMASAAQLPPEQLRRRRSLPDDIDPQRFEVVINLLRFTDGSRLRLRVQVPEDDPTFPTLTDLWFGTDAAEREVYDMFGITFTDHPDLSRILMPEDWVGHPLRKDYYAGRIPVQFKGDPASEGR
jgi:NADH-quinone oxidoreductase subunit C